VSIYIPDGRASFSRRLGRALCELGNSRAPWILKSRRRFGAASRIRSGAGRFGESLPEVQSNRGACLSNRL
jgi:hypothetical protein